MRGHLSLQLVGNVVAQPLNSSDFPAVGMYGEGKAAVHRLSIKKNCAHSALAKPAVHFHASVAQVPQNIHQRLIDTYLKSG
jgi:hypothetical protein